MQGEAERALRRRPPSLPNRPHFDADSIDSAIPRPKEIKNVRCEGAGVRRSGTLALSHRSISTYGRGGARAGTIVAGSGQLPS